MSGIPVLKFEKSTNYLNSQLDIQLNNKQLVSDIITNIGLIISEKDINEKTSLLYIKNSASNFKKSISENITVIEELKREIKYITSDLSEVIEEINKKEKSKEYYIVTISAIKKNIENYTSKFQCFEKKLSDDNINFNEFINKNNFKYNFVSNSDNTYDYSGFSVESPATKDDNSEESIVTPKDIKISKLTNEFKGILSNLSEDTILSLDLISALKTEFSSQKAEENETNESLENKKEPDDDTNEDTSSESNLVIDYSSIYKNYYNKKASTIEENISSEYSSFVPPLNTITPILHETNNKENTDSTTQFWGLEDEAEENQNINLELEDENEPEENLNINIELENENEPEENLNINLELEDENEPVENLNINTELEDENEPVKNLNVNIELEDENEPVENLNINTELEDNLTDEEITNELVKELLENELFEDTKPSENIEINDEDLLDEILKEEINIDDIILNDEELTKELLNVSPVVEDISILDSISDDEILEQLLISDFATDELLKDYTSNDNNSSLEEKNTSNNLMDYCNIEEKIEIIKNATSNNDTLIISEKQKKVFLPYTIEELQQYLNNYPDIYHSAKDVVEQKFVLPFDKILKHQAQSRFFETYNLIKNKENKSPILAIVYGIKLFCKYNLNPAIIAACKNQKQLDSYLKCLKNNELNKFNFFKIVYQVNPL